MRQSHEIKTLGELRTICSVQRMAIEMQVARANVELQQLDDQLQSEIRTLKAVQDGWRQSVSGKSLHLAAASQWSAQFTRTEAEIERLNHDLITAKAARNDLYSAQTRALARGDAAEDLLHTAIIQERRYREETILEAYSNRRSGGWSFA